MQTDLFAVLFATGAVVLAEMGDKTQLLAMAFATKYKASKVLLGVFLATVLNHALAVAVGNYITRFEGAQVWIQAVASLSFIFFGLWTLRGDRLDGEQNRKTRYGAVMTVAIAFFLAEMGDKTQLATIALSTKFPDSPIGVLVGTTTGMLIADAIGIVVGVLLCKKIPQKTIKLVSAAAFMMFGFIGSYQVASAQLKLSSGLTLLVLFILVVVSAVAAFFVLKKSKEDAERNPVDDAFCKPESEVESK